MDLKRATFELIATVLLGLSLGAVGMITCLGLKATTTIASEMLRSLF